MTRIPMSVTEKVLYPLLALAVAFALSCAVCGFEGIVALTTKGTDELLADLAKGGAE